MTKAHEATSGVPPTGPALATEKEMHQLETDCTYGTYPRVVIDRTRARVINV